MGLSFTIPAGLASEVILRSESRGTHDHILLSQIRDSPNQEGQVQYLYPPGRWWPDYNIRHWVLLLYLRLGHAMHLRCWSERNNRILEFRYFFILICFHGNLITEPLHSSGRFLECDWRLACRRSASLYVVANGTQANGPWICRGPRWSASAWFNVGHSHRPKPLSCTYFSVRYFVVIPSLVAI
jgi:hypothetical protein